MSPQRPVTVVVLAAGEGVRMRSTTPKVLHELGGRSMLGHVVATARGLTPDRLLVVVGHGRDRVVEQLAGIDSDAKAIVQGEQRGPGRRGGDRGEPHARRSDSAYGIATRPMPTAPTSATSGRPKKTANASTDDA